MNTTLETLSIGSKFSFAEYPGHRWEVVAIGAGEVRAYRARTGQLHWFKDCSQVIERKATA